MAINLELNKSQLDDPNADNISVHYIPASIKGDGQAKVDMFFTADTTEENGTLKNAFRGHPLLGCKFNVPHDYKGLIFRETDNPLDENASRVFKCDGLFTSIHYWNYDKVPTKGDAFRQAWDVTRVAETLCSDVALDEIEQKVALRNNT